jgi:hypothetical protein
MIHRFNSLLRPRLKTVILFSLAAVILPANYLPVSAQMYSPRRLTQRINPTAPGQPTGAAQGAAAPQLVPGTVPPAKSLTPETPLKAGDEPVPTPQPPPLTIECKKIEPDPRQSLQSITLTLTNTSAKAVSFVTMRMIYLDDKGTKLKEWTTRRELDPVLPPNSNVELDQPAYYMPLVTKHVKVELEAARFTDGTEWTPGTMTVASH